MDADILCTLLAQRIPPEQFQVHGEEVVFYDKDEGVNKPAGSSHESPYDTPEPERAMLPALTFPQLPYIST
jgi:hypothetical protein